MKIELDPSDLAAIAAAVVDEIARREPLASPLPSNRLGAPGAKGLAAAWLAILPDARHLTSRRD